MALQSLRMMNSGVIYMELSELSTEVGPFKIAVHSGHIYIVICCKTAIKICGGEWGTSKLLFHYLTV